MRDQSSSVRIRCALALIVSCASSAGCAEGLLDNEDAATAVADSNDATPVMAPDAAPYSIDDAGSGAMAGRDVIAEASVAAPDAATDAPRDAGTMEHDVSTVPAHDAGMDPCETLFDHSGLLHTSVDGNLRYVGHFPTTASAYRRVEISLDVFLAAWTPKQGQYEAFTLMRGHRWVGGAIGYVSFIGPARRATVMSANLGLEGAAADPTMPDGRRVSRSYAYETGTTYHLDYFYDAGASMRRLDVSSGGGVATTLSSTTPVSTIDVPSEGFTLVLGGAQVDGAPDSSTIGWRFSNVRVRACR